MKKDICDLRDDHEKYINQARAIISLLPQKDDDYTGHPRFVVDYATWAARDLLKKADKTFEALYRQVTD